MYVNPAEDDPVGRLELALALAPHAEALDAKLRAAAREGAIHGSTDEARRRSAVAQGLLSADELAALERYRALQRACIMVDDFPSDIGRHARSDPSRHAVADDVGYEPPVGASRKTA